MRSMVDREEWITTAQAAEEVPLSRETVRRLFLRDGAPTHFRTPGGHLRISRAALIDWWNRRKAQEQSA